METLPITNILNLCSTHYYIVICKPHGLQLALIVHGLNATNNAIANVAITCLPYYCNVICETHG